MNIQPLPFDLKNKTDYNNFVFVESRLPEILNQVLSIHLSSGISDLATICKKLTLLNPLNFNLIHGHNFYEYKLRQFTTAIGFGMRPLNIWRGIYNLSEVVAEVLKSGSDLESKYNLPRDIERYFFENAIIKMDNETSDGRFYIVFE